MSLVLEQLLGENYHDKSLTVLKPHHISATSFQTPSTSKVSLTYHMLKVANLSKEPEQSLIHSSEEVNVEESADKSQFKTNVSKDSKEMNPPSTTIHLQASKEFVYIIVPIQSLEASISEEVQDNQPKAADAIESETKRLIRLMLTQKILTLLDYHVMHEYAPLYASPLLPHSA
ncbi:hypothetical protein Tco_0109733 [Tanacetum coccineum]